MFKFLPRTILLSAFSLVLSSGPLWAKTAETTAMAQLEGVSAAFSSVAKKVKPTVVTIETSYAQAEVRQGNPYFRQWMPQQQQAPRGSASGVIYDNQGNIITNAHVVEEASNIEVVLSDGRRLKAELVGQDPKTDLAVIRVKGNTAPLNVAIYGDSDTMNVGEWVIAIGNPLGLSHTVTHGIISAVGRSGLRNDLVGAYEDFIQTDASINQGNSGGPLCNLKGEVIGINSMIASQSGGSQGLGFSIPINMARSIVDQLIRHGKVQRGFLGVSIKDMSLELAQQFGAKTHEGALVDEVGPNSPAEKAGIKSGDIIVGLNDKAVLNSTELRNRISQMSPNLEVNLKIIRDGVEKPLKVVLGNLDGVNGAKDLIGVNVRALDPEMLERFRLEGGVIVESVEPNSPAMIAGVRPQMVITSVDRKPIRQSDDFNRFVADSLKGDDSAVLLYVRTATQGYYLVVNVNK